MSIYCQELICFYNDKFKGYPTLCCHRQNHSFLQCARGIPGSKLKSSGPNCSVGFSFSPQSDPQHLSSPKRPARTWLTGCAEAGDSPCCEDGPGWEGPAKWAPVSSRLWVGSSVAGRTLSNGLLPRTAVCIRKGQ